MKLPLVLACAFASASSILAATPPACLLSAVNTQNNPSDLSAVCGASAFKVQSAIASICTGDNVGIAQSAFISTCSVAGRTVEPYTSSSASASASASTPASSVSGVLVYTAAVYDSSCSCTKMMTVTSTSGASTAHLSASSSGTSRTGGSGGGSAGSAGATSTAGAMPQGEKNRRMRGYAAAAVALVGAVGAL